MEVNVRNLASRPEQTLPIKILITMFLNICKRVKREKKKWGRIAESPCSLQPGMKPFAAWSSHLSVVWALPSGPSWNPSCLRCTSEQGNSRSEGDFVAGALYLPHGAAGSHPRKEGRPRAWRSHFIWLLLFLPLCFFPFATVLISLRDFSKKVIMVMNT